MVHFGQSSICDLRRLGRNAEDAGQAQTWRLCAQDMPGHASPQQHKLEMEGAKHVHMKAREE